MEQTKKLLSDAGVLLALAAERIKNPASGLTANRQDALNALNDIVAIIEDEVIPTVAVESDVLDEALDATEARAEVLQDAFFKLYDAIIVIEESQNDVPADDFDQWLKIAGQTTVLKQAAKILSENVGQQITLDRSIGTFVLRHGGNGTR